MSFAFPIVKGALVCPRCKSLDVGFGGQVGPKWVCASCHHRFHEPFTQVNTDLTAYDIEQLIVILKDCASDDDGAIDYPYYIKRLREMKAYL